MLVLGPVLFLIYINNLDKDIESALIKCVDDRKREGLANILQFTKVNKIIFSADFIHSVITFLCIPLHQLVNANI